MGALLIAYLTALAATSTYIARLAIRNSRLATRAEALRRTGELNERADLHSKVA